MTATIIHALAEMFFCGVLILSIYAIVKTVREA
jgi:hypothetical protein